MKAVLEGRLILSVQGLLNSEARNQVNAGPMERAGQMGCEVHATHKLAGLERVDQLVAGIEKRFRAGEEPGRGVQRIPQRNIRRDLVIPAGELGFGKLTDCHRIGEKSRDLPGGIGHGNFGLLVVFHS